MSAIMIKPITGDTTAPIFSTGGTSDAPIGTLDSGTILKSVGKSNGYYEVQYENNLPDGAQGGTANTGSVIASPNTYMYADIDRINILGKLNNGTQITIEDDSDIVMYKVTGLTTEGTYTGYMYSKYIFRDSVESESQTRILTRNITEPTAGKVTGTGTSGLNVRTGPSTSDQRVGTLPEGTAVLVKESKNGWYNIDAAAYEDVWVSSSYVVVGDTNTTAQVSTTDAVDISGTTTNDTSSAATNTQTSAAEYVSLFNSVGTGGSGEFASDEYYKQLADKYSFALGAPPKYNVDIDPQYANDITAGYGRAYAKAILTSPSILSICPGTVQMFPNALGEQKDTIQEAMLEFAGGNQSLVDKIMSDEGGAFSGKMYAFKADTDSYAGYLNALCRACAILGGIGERYMPNTATKLKEFDYAYWTIRRRYNPGVNTTDADTSIFKNFFDGLVYSAQSLPEVATGDTTYMNFFLNSAETSVNETMQTDVTSGPLSELIESVSTVGSQINYFTGSGFSSTVDEAEKAISSILGGTGGDTVKGILNMGENFLKGGRMVMPKMLAGATYGKSVSCSMKYVSPYGDFYSIFLRCIIPVCHLLAMALPRQLSDNMYTFPFVVRCAQLGAANIDLGVITGITLNRGGQDDTSWTIDSIATEWDVQLEITPLIDDLMITSTKNPLLFCKNENLLDYLGNFCGFDLLASNLGTKADLVATFLTSRVRDIPNNLGNKLSDVAYNKLNAFFNFKL